MALLWVVEEITWLYAAESIRENLVVCFCWHSVTCFVVASKASGWVSSHPAILYVGGGMRVKKREFCIIALQMNPSMTKNLDCCVAFPSDIDISVLALTRRMAVPFALDAGQA